MRISFILVAFATILTACAKNADKISASYVSPILYENLTCEQIAQESIRASTRAATLTGQQNKQATKDAVTMGVGLVVFWPALFFVKGNDQQTAELARLKGEVDALEHASISKNCGIEFRTQ